MRKNTILVLLLLGSLFFLLVNKGVTPDFEFTNVVIETTSTNATIRWSTTVDTKPNMEYYAEENFTRWGRYHLASMHDYPYSSNSSITVYNVKPNTTYLFRVTARDINDNPEYFESNFTTSARDTSIIQPVEAKLVGYANYGIVRQIFESLLVVVIFSVIFFLLRRR